MKMAKHLKDLLAEGRVSGFRRHFSIPDEVHLSLVMDNTLDMKREDQNSIVFPLLSIAEGGGRFPLHPFLRVVLRYWGLIPSLTRILYNSSPSTLVSLVPRKSSSLFFAILLFVYHFHFGEPFIPCENGQTLERPPF